jgi:hypothetical protein
MLPAILTLISVGLLIWLAVEIRLAHRFGREGIPVEASVSRREWVSSGQRGRNLRIWLALQKENTIQEYLMGYMSFFGFRSLKVGDKLTVLWHPAINYVIPAGKMGLIARPAIAGSLFLAASICATAFTLATLTK